MNFLRRTPPARGTAVLCLIYIVLSCSQKSGLVSHFEDISLTLSIVSGNNQTYDNDAVLDDPIVVRVTDASGAGIEGMTIRFEIIEGGFRLLDGSTVETNADGIAQNRWEIGPSYNALEVTVEDPGFETSPCYVYAAGRGPRGMDETRTINSLVHLGARLYGMTFYGDYSEILDTMDDRYRSYLSKQNRTDHYHCSLFSALGDPEAALFGRSFDNPAGWECLTLIGRYDPPDGYRSLALVRMQDFGYEPGADFEHMSLGEKHNLLRAPFFPPDGINEHGVVAGLANVRPLEYHYDYTKKTIFITRLVREILDHARDVDEAVEIARNHNVHCGGLTSLNVHTLVADATGRSVILEIYDGEMEAISNSESWQVLTNSPVYGLPFYAQCAACPRFDEVYTSLDRVHGQIDTDDAFGILQRVGNPYSEWSAVYEMTTRAMEVVIDYDFSTRYRFDFNDTVFW